MLYIIYAGIESLIKTIDGYARNPENFQQQKQVSIFLVENKHTLYRGEDCMKKFCTSLRQDTTKVLNFEKKKMLPLTKKELKLPQNATECHICQKKIFENVL